MAELNLNGDLSLDATAVSYASLKQNVLDEVEVTLVCFAFITRYRLMTVHCKNFPEEIGL